VFRLQQNFVYVDDTTKPNNQKTIMAEFCKLNRLWDYSGNFTGNLESSQNKNPKMVSEKYLINCFIT